MMAAVGEFQPVRDDQTGELFLPASRRPDGTWRKPRRVKEGYVPQDEVPAYESKGKQWAKSQPSYPVGMSPLMIAAQEQLKQSQGSSKDDKPSIPGLPPSTAKPATKKKKKKSSQDGGVKDATTKMAAFTIEEPVFSVPDKGVAKKTSAPVLKSEAPKQDSSVTTAAAATEPSKKLKNLKKKLRDTELLEEKIKSGELKNPDKDQLEKIKRKSEVVKEIKELEKLLK
nr:EOG090X0KVN [Sida crystallina]